ncbi:MAG: RNA polymerase sigma factor [Myxococcales bacterium]|nr:RNA polymerase sigma factor [Myxococcales bacterium]
MSKGPASNQVQRSAGCTRSTAVLELRHPPTTTAEPSAPLSFDDVYRAYFLHVARWARALGGLDADMDDLAQEVFLVVHRQLDSFSGPSLPAWLYGITRRTVSDYRRRAWMRRLLGGLVKGLGGPREAQRQPVDHPHEAWEARRLLTHALEQMSPAQATAFILFELEGYSGPEIAELEQIPVATAYTRLHHARRDFLRLVAAAGNIPEEATES